MSILEILTIILVTLMGFAIVWLHLQAKEQERIIEAQRRNLTTTAKEVIRIKRHLGLDSLPYGQQPMSALEGER